MKIDVTIIVRYSKYSKLAEASIKNGYDLDRVPIDKLFVVDDMIFLEEFTQGLAFFLCFLRFLGYMKIFPHVMKTIHLVFLMMSKIVIYILFQDILMV